MSPPPKKTKTKTELNYLISEGSISLTLRQNCAKWHKDCALEVTSSTFKRALSNVSKNETKNELPRKMKRGSLSVPQSISNAICFFCDSGGVFSKEEYAGSSKHIEKHLLHRVESFDRGDLCYDKQQHKL